MPPNAPDSLAAPTERGSVAEVARVFAWLGVSAFGGPAAHIAAMEDTLVTRRRWLSRDTFIDLVGAANLIPGPNSTELAIHLGYRRAGGAGFIAAGVCFIVPAVAIVWLFAMAYVAYGARVEVQAMLAGVQPVVLAVVVQAAWRLRTTVLRDVWSMAIALATLIGAFLGVWEPWLLLGAVAIGAARAMRVPRDARDNHERCAAAPLFALPLLTAAPLLPAWSVFRSFLTIGSVLYGSGYVLLAFLRSEFVERLHVLSEPQLLDAIAIGQVTPGPVFSAATFVGYLIAGHAGAAAATAGIFLPAFVGVALTAPLVHRMRRSPRLGLVLDAVNAASLALLLGVVLLMARSVAISPLGIAIFLGAAAVLLATRLGAGWVLLGGGLAGLLRLAL